MRLKPTVAAVAVAIGMLLAIAPVAAGAAGRGDARVQGVFAMHARVTVAFRVPGEHAGQRLRRTWAILPQSCSGSVCTRLRLVRERAGRKITRLTLRRTGPGRYAGQGAFFVALRCRGRVYRRGSRVPYRITLSVASSVQVQGIRFARSIRASYVNRSRSDATPCPLGPSHDAARYSGRATSPVPAPPTAAFTASVEPVTRTATFTDSSAPGPGGAPIVAWAWDFGDPASGPQDHSTQPQASHVYTAPGTYTVTLVVRDANGLTATSTQEITVPAPAPAPAPAPSGSAGGAGAQAGASRSVATTALSSAISRWAG